MKEVERKFKLNRVRQLRLSAWEILNMFSVAQLRNLAKDLGIPTSVDKPDLVSRLKAARGRLGMDAEVTITLKY